MSERSGEVVQAFGDGEHTFRLGIKQLEELQEKCDAGPLMVMRRLLDGGWRLADVRDTVRLGLIGGGMTSAEAIKLVARYCSEGQLSEGVVVAQAVLGVAIFGPGEEEPGKSQAGAKT